MMTSGNFDVIVIGAGSIGTPAAMYMAKAGLKVLVIEKFASAGQGSNKAAIGGVRATHSDPAKIRLGLRSVEVFSTWQQTHDQDIEWRSGGYCFVAYTESDERKLKGQLSIQQSYGLNIAWKGADEIRDLIPDIHPVDLRGGTLSPEDGHCSNLLANHAFFQEASQAGAVFHFQEKVLEIPSDHQRVTGVKTDRGSYHAAVVINAAGAWAAQVGQMAGIEHPVRPDTHEAGITEPVAPFINPLIVDIRPGHCSANVYFYQQTTGQINFCLTPDPQIWGYNCQETSEFLPLVSRRMIELVPRLAGIRVRRTWRGMYPMTPDGSPIIGWWDQMEGYLTAIGMCGQGFMFGPGVGELLTRMVMQKDLSTEDQQILQILSPRRSFMGKETLK